MSGMRVVEVRPAGIVFTVELTLEALKKIELALSKSNITYDSQVPEEDEAVKFLTTEFCPLVSDMIKRATT